MKNRLILQTVAAMLSISIVSMNSLIAADNSLSWQSQLVSAAIARTQHQVVYSGQYIAIEYPGGDVPSDIGVCTDVVIRSYRQLGIDLQQKVHEDMLVNFKQYPQFWGLSRPDSNIDHRRVPNLQHFFKRFGESLAITDNPEDYQPGDIVSWMLAGNLPHIGIVSNNKTDDQQRFMVIHNIGRGPEQQDFLFAATITGHYQYSGNSAIR